MVSTYVVILYFSKWSCVFYLKLKKVAHLFRCSVIDDCSYNLVIGETERNTYIFKLRRMQNSIYIFILKPFEKNECRRKYVFLSGHGMFWCQIPTMAPSQYPIRRRIMISRKVSNAWDLLLKCSYRFEIWHIVSSAADVPIKFRSDRIILNTNIVPSRFCEILEKDVLSDIETGPRPSATTIMTRIWNNVIFVIPFCYNPYINFVWDRRVHNHSHLVLKYDAPV